MLLNVLLFVGLIYLIVQIIKDVKNFFKNDNSDFKS
jgi:hypothetical protein